MLAGQTMISPQFISFLRCLVEQRKASVQEVHNMLLEVGVEVSERTLQRWVYKDVVEGCLHPPATPPETGSWARGELHHNNTLSKEQVRKVYLSKRSPSDLAEMVGCEPANIHHILRKRRWKWFTDQIDQEVQRVG